MVDTHQFSTWDPLDYLSTEELARIDERFDSVLGNEASLVFWTGLSPEIAKRWADQHGLQTLVTAMGHLYSDSNVGSPRYGKSTEGWSKYMKGASGRFAEYTCRGGRVAIVLTKPPPNTYSTRDVSTYRCIEEPILKGAFGRPGAVQINYVHPTIKDTAAFQYQIWPLNRSNEWFVFLRNLFPQGCSACDVTDRSVNNEPINRADTKPKPVTQNQPNILTLACKKQPQCQEKEGRQKKAELEQRQAQERMQAEAEVDEASQKTAKLEQQHAQQIRQAEAQVKKARQKKAELEQQQAQERKRAKGATKEVIQRMVVQQAREQTQAKAEENEVKQKKAKLLQRQVQERTQAKAREKDARQKKAKLEQQQARVRRKLIESETRRLGQ